MYTESMFRLKDIYMHFKKYLYAFSPKNLSQKDSTHIYQPLRSGRIWHKVNF